MIKMSESGSERRRPELVGPKETESEKCPHCGLRNSLFKNGTELCGRCYGIYMDYFPDADRSIDSDTDR